LTKFNLKTPVAFIIFNRPENTERVFAEIAKAKPPKLLVVADGPRVNQKDDVEKVAATRTIIKNVNWDCEVLTNFSDVNLGCKIRVSSGINWVFEHVEEAIILEDDCLPNASFFQYCQEMLVRYRLDRRIGMVSGNNFQFGHREIKNSYYFSKYCHIWGWASWRDRWAGSYDVRMSKWKTICDEYQLVDLVGDEREAKYWGKIFDRVYRGKVDTWDYQWVFANWVEGRISIMPSLNLISNIGFDANATHTTGVSDVANLPTFELEFPLKHPVGVFRNIKADRINYHNSCKIPLWKRVYWKMVDFRMKVKFNCLKW
jgi:hypothetical protein